jgi:hypothetical protein
MPVLKHEVVYPIFLKCLKYTVDPFWQNIFEELAYNNCVQGSYISKGFFCSNIKGKEFNYKFIDKSPVVIHNEIIKLLRDKLNIMSKNDRKNILEEIQLIEKELELYKKIEWSSIKKKSIKDILIQNFLIKAKYTYDIKNTQIKKLYNLINLGLMLKSIKNSDIVYKNGEISDIVGITFDKGKYYCSIDIFSSLEEEVIIKNLCRTKKLLKNL